MLGARKRGTTPTPQLDRSPHRASHPQQEVEVGRGVHGIKYIGIVRDHQLSLLRDDLYQLVSLIRLHLQVVLGHGSRNYSRSLVLVGQQYALVEVPVALLQTDSYDACVLGLSVISWGLAWRARGQGCEGDGASVGAGGAGE